MVKASDIRPNRSDRELDRRIAALALPALGSIAAEPAYSLADTAIVGHLGRVPLDSLAIASTALTMTRRPADRHARLVPAGVAARRAGGSRPGVRQLVTAALAFWVPALFTSDLAYVPVAALVLRFHALGLPGIWIALGLWLAARAALLGQRWRTQFRDRQ